VWAIEERDRPLFEERFDLSQERGELRLENVPDDSIVNVCVTVNQDVAERDDALVLVNPPDSWYSRTITLKFSRSPRS